MSDENYEISLTGDELKALVDALDHAIEESVNNENNAPNDKWTLTRLATEIEDRVRVRRKILHQTEPD